MPARTGLRIAIGIAGGVERQLGDLVDPEVIGVRVARLVPRVGDDHLGRVRRMTATRRPTASSSGAAAKLRGSELAGLSGMPESR